MFKWPFVDANGSHRQQQIADMKFRLKSTLFNNLGIYIYSFFIFVVVQKLLLFMKLFELFVIGIDPLTARLCIGD